jgi:hypothetical protein
VKDCFAKQKTKFSSSLEWYAVTIKNDMHARDVLKVFMEKRKKLHSSPGFRYAEDFNLMT